MASTPVIVTNKTGFTSYIDITFKSAHGIYKHDHQEWLTKYVSLTSKTVYLYVQKVNWKIVLQEVKEGVKLNVFLFDPPV